MKRTFIQNTIKKAAVLSVGALLVASCTDNFEDYNRDPGKPTEKEILEGHYKLGAFFPQMIAFAYPAQENAYQMCENLIGDPYGRYLSIANTWTATFSTFNAPDGWINWPFENIFPKIYGGWGQVKEMTNGEGFRFAWAQIIRVTAMQRMTDLYGPIPYSKIGGEGIVAAYDSQQEAYKAMFADLDKAIEELIKFDAENPDYRKTAEFDPVYSGMFKKWIQYANSLKLRMAMRIVYADPVLAKQKAEEAVNSPGGLIRINEDNALNKYPSNPVHKMTTDWGDSRACADIVSYMNGYKDPRLSKYFTKSVVKGSSTYHGLRTGIEIMSKSAAGEYSSTTYLKEERLLWMNAAEVSFLLAEGALRKWDMGGTAKDFYEEGIKLSFSQWGAMGLESYLADATSVQADYNDPNVDLSTKAVSTITIRWEESDPFEKKLERLITQKWLAMFPLGQEAWSEHRRTGYPHFFPVMINKNEDAGLKTAFAARIPFAVSEKQNNEKNYNEAVSYLGGPDNYSTKLWWDKNPNKPK